MSTERSSAWHPPLPAGVTAGRIVAIGRRLEPARVLAVGEALIEAGVGAFELTLNEPEAEALASIETLAGRLGDRLLVGAGTVMSVGAAERAVNAGAAFLVSPHTDVAIVSWAAARGIPAMPGALTPTEAVRGWAAGAAAIKLFPASVAGPAFIREIRGPLPDVPFIPTGGVSAENAGAFIRAGAVAVGLGSWLIGDGEAAGVRARAEQVRAAIAAALERGAGGGTGTGR